MSHLPSRPPPPPPGGQPPPPPAGPGTRADALGDPAWPPGPRQDGASAADAFRVPFSVMDGFLAILWLILVQFVVIVPPVAFGLIDFEGGGAPLLLLVITYQALALAAALGWLAARNRLSWRLLGPERPRASHWGWGLVTGLAGYLGVTLVMMVLVLIFGPVEPPDQQVLRDLTAGGAATALAVVAAVVMAPLLEEVVFRGILFQALKRRTGLWPAVVISSLLFAVIHMGEVTQPVFLFGFFLLGATFAVVYHRTGSLVVPILAHAGYNGITVLLALLAQDLPHVV